MTDRVYRWSPNPPPGGHFSGDTRLWNLYWISALTGWSEQVETAVRLTYNMRLRSSAGAELLMANLLTIPATSFAIVAGGSQNYDDIPLTKMIPDLRRVWALRAREARGEHPKALARLMDAEVKDTTQAAKALERIKSKI